MRFGPDGFIYEGNYSSGLPNGCGMQKYTNNEKIDPETGTSAKNTLCYIGRFQNGKRQGKKAVQYFGLGSKYEGEFQNDKANGYGEMTFENGDMRNHYRGYFKNNKFHGRGKLTFNGSETVAGEFYEGSHNLKLSSFIL